MIIVTTVCIACSSKKSAVFIVRDFPKGIEISNFKEKYDAYNGQYEVEFTYTNNTDKKLKIPSLAADFYIAGKKEGYSDGGTVDALDAKGGYGQASVHTILPKESADSVVFYFNGTFTK